MKSFDSDIKKYSEKVALSVSEKRMLRERLVSYMEYHPYMKTSARKSAPQIQAIPAEPFFIFRFSSLHLRALSGVLMVILVAMPFVAERSVPGDVLYLVKTGFNEQLQAGFASSPYEKIEFETKLMERRISEARALASEGKLTDEVQAQLQETVKEHTDAVQTSLAELRTQNADEAAIAQIAFSASLEVQSAVLDDTSNATNTDAIAGLLTVVNDARVISDSQQGSTSPSFEGLLARVELETTRAYELFDSVKISATPDEVKDIERRIHDAERLIKEAKGDRDTQPEKASDNLAMTLGLLQKLIVFMANIDVRETVELETIVPVMLSDTERLDVLKETMRTLTETRAQVVERVPSLQGEGVISKVEEALLHVDETFKTIEIAIEGKDIAAAEAYVHEMRLLLEDLAELTKPNSGEVKETLPEEISEEPLTSEGTTTPEVVE